MSVEPQRWSHEERLALAYEIMKGRSGHWDLWLNRFRHRWVFSDLEVLRFEGSGVDYTHECWSLTGFHVMRPTYDPTISSSKFEGLSECLG